jgi:hypothetical protein
MKNIVKTLIVMLASVSLFASAHAGSLGVSGSAKATYNIKSGANAGKGLGITNELNFTAAGELENGYTWSYSMELDPGATQVTGDTDTEGSQSAQNDDTKLTLSTPYGTVGVFISEGGLDLEDGASQSVYARPTDIGDPSATSDNFTIDAYNNVQYHTPADLLPLGISGKIAYAPDLDSYGSGNNAGVAHVEGTVGYVGRSATEMQVKMAPIDGLTIGASYFEFDNQGGTKKDQNAESGAYMAEYAIGNVSVGYSKAYKALLISDNSGNSETVDYYDQTNMSAAYAINDDLSVSYEKETSEANYIISTTAAVEQKSTSIQIAYNLGGATLALVRSGHDNNGYVAAANQDQTVFAVTMAF